MSITLADLRQVDENNSITDKMFTFWHVPEGQQVTLRILKGREVSKFNQHHIKLDDFGGKTSRFTRDVEQKKKRDDNDFDYDDDIGQEVKPYHMSRMAHGKRHFPR